VASTNNRPGRGDLVTYRHPDVITGAVLEGAAVVIGTGDDGGIWIRPLAEHSIVADPENVVPVTADDLDGEPDPAGRTDGGVRGRRPGG
jgi:hypothetical protein